MCGKCSSAGLPVGRLLDDRRADGVRVDDEQNQFVDVGVVAVDHVVDLVLVGGVDEPLVGERSATGGRRVRPGPLGRGPVGRQGGVVDHAG